MRIACCILGALTAMASLSCQPPAMAVPAPSLTEQCQNLVQPLRDSNVPVAPRSPTDVDALSWTHCSDVYRAISSIVLTDQTMKSGRRGLAQAYNMCSERLHRAKARWTLLKETPESPAHEAERKRLVSSITKIFETLPVEAEPHLIAFDDRCGEGTFMPRVDVVR